MDICSTSSAFSSITISLTLTVLDSSSTLPQQELDSVLNQLSTRGLRTLVYGVRDLTLNKPFVDHWRASYNHARGLVGTAKEEALRKCIEEMECGIHIVGCTGIEDKLQVRWWLTTVRLLYPS